MAQAYQDLQVWQKSMDMTVAVYEASKGFPREEIYGLTSQIRRAAVSVASNIAEGRGRISPGESFVNFLEQHKVQTSKYKLNWLWRNAWAMAYRHH